MARRTQLASEHGLLEPPREANGSADSLDSLLAQFEIIQTSPSTELQQFSAPPQSPLASFFQRAALPQTPDTPETRACTAALHTGFQTHNLRRSPGAAAQSASQLHTNVHLTEDSPALASASHQQQHRSSLCGSLSLESLNTLSTSSEEQQQASGEELEQQLFPLGEALSTLYRPASEASLSSQEPLQLSAAAPFEALPGATLSTAAEQILEGDTTNEAASASSEASGLTSEDRAASCADNEQKLTNTSALSPLRVSAQAQPSGGASVPPPVSPFAAAALLPAPESVSSQEGSSYKSSKSASDYGSQNPEWRPVVLPGNDRGHAVDYAKTGLAYGKPTTDLRPLLHIEYREKFAQGRSHLRKRDYESELLERLLSRAPRGPSFGNYSRPLPQDARLGWRALGFPKMAFVTIIFLCLALFLLVFSAGRMHAHRIMRAMPLAPLAANPASALPMGVSIPGIIPEELAVARKHHILAAAAAHETLHLEKPSFKDSAGPEALTAHERRQGFTQSSGSPDTRKRLIVGLRMLEPKR